MAENDNEGWGLVMPFVVTQSVGGPYDDAAFCAGYRAGVIDADLALLSGYPTSRRQYTVEPSLVGQLDLIAMRHGFRMTTEPWDEHPDEWVYVTFEDNGDDDV